MQSRWLHFLLLLILIYMKNMINENRLDRIIQESINKMILEMSPRPMKPQDVFIVQAKNIHGDKYDYSKVVYNGTDEPVTIICPEHGEFQQTPHHHLEGQGCHACVREYKLETRTANELNKRGVEFIKNKPPFDWLGRLQLDFYIPALNVAIECQGIQHYQPRQRFGGDKGYAVQIERDKRKKALCDSHGVPLYFISYKDYKNIPSIVDEIIKNHTPNPK